MVWVSWVCMWVQRAEVGVERATSKGRFLEVLLLERIGEGYRVGSRV